MKNVKSFLLLASLFMIVSLVEAREYFIKLRDNRYQNEVFQQIEKQLSIKTPGFRIEAARAFKRLHQLGLDRVYVLNLPEAPETLALIGQMPQVEYIEAVPEYKMEYTPNDYNSTLLWHLAKINAVKAWDIERGGKGVVVGLVDDGMDTAHSDLQPVLWHNTGEIKGNGIDDDANGYVDDFFGWDVADNDNNPSVVVSNNLSHGTHCAGIISARTDNNNGIASIGFNLRIMPLKCGRNGSPFIFNGYQGVEYAIDNGARVVSMSWGGTGYSATYQTLFDVAYSMNIICVAAAGNASTNTAHYPAAYDHVIAVGNTDNSDRIHSSSNYGTWVDLMAPGAGIYSTMPGNSYGYKTGTSMACPMVAGLCALMISKNPSITNADLEKCLKSACDNINSQNTSYTGQIGSGRINAFNTLSCVKPVVARIGSSKQFVCTGDTMRYFDQSAPSSTSRVWTFTGGTPSLSAAQNPIVRYSTFGVYKVQLIAQKGSDADTIEMLNYVTVGKPTVKFSGLQTIQKGEFATVKADFTGVPPWTLIYTDGKKKDTIQQILTSPYFILKSPDSTVTYKPLAVYSPGSCAGTVADSSRIRITNGTSFCDSALRFHMSFGGSGDDEGWAVKGFDDSIIYVAGRTLSNSKGGYDAFLAKITTSGRQLWFKSIGGSDNDGFFTLSIDKHENIYCGGYTYSDVTNRGSFMVKIDKSGNLKWKKYYHGSSHEYIFESALSAKNDYIYFTGHSAYNGYGSSDFTVYKFDTLGNIKWVKQIGTSSQERPYSIVLDDSGNVYIAGIVTTSTNQLHLFKLDSSGNVKFSKSYSNGSGAVFEYRDAALWDKNTLYLVGVIDASGSRKHLLSKVNVNGNIIWTKQMSLPNAGLPKISIRNGKIVIIDYLSISSQSYGMIYSVDSNGNILTARRIGNANDMYLIEAELNEDGYLNYVGYETISGDNQVVIGRTNCKLDNICLFQSLSMSVSNFSTTESNYPMSSKNFTNTTTTSHTLVTQNHSVNVVCKAGKKFIKKEKCRLGADFKIRGNCIGDTVILNDLSVDSSGYAINGWYWQFGDGAVTSGKATAKHVFSNKGTYKVQLIVLSSKDGVTCADTVQKNYQAVDSFHINMPPDKMICIGDSFRVDLATLDCGKGPYFYKWTPSSGVDIPTIAQPYFSPKVTTQYNLEVSDINGKVTNGKMKVTIDNSCCKSIARFAADKSAICQNDTIRFMNMSTYDENSYYFVWKFTGANISSYVGINPPPVVFKSAGTAKVQLFLSDICSNDSVLQQVLIYKLPEAYAGRDTLLCVSDTVQLGMEAFGRNIYTWTPSTGLNNPYLSDPYSTVSASVKYALAVIDENGCVNRDSVTVELQPLSIVIAGDTSICSYDSVLLTIPGTGKYLWNTNATSQSVYVKAGTYWGMLETATCSAKDTVIVQIQPSPVFSLGIDTGFCLGDSVLLKTSVVGTYLWNTGSTINSIYAKQGAYWLSVTSAGCTFRDSVNVIEKPLPVFTLGADTGYCERSIFVLKAPIAGKYLWSDNSSSNSLNVNLTGTYWLSVTSGTCSFRDSVDIIEKPLPVFSFGSDTSFCTGVFVKFTAPIAGKYLWSTGANTNQIDINKKGVYWLEIDVAGCTYRDSVNVQEHALPVFSLGQDRPYCQDSIRLAPSVMFPGSGYKWNTGASASSIYIKNAGTYSLAITDPNDCIFRDSIYLHTGILPSLRVDDVYKCEGVNFRVDIETLPGHVYRWFDNSSGPSHLFTKTGTYWVIDRTECGDTQILFKVMDSSCTCGVWVPNVFSPNRNGHNEVFRQVSECNLIDYRMRIYNRWGEMIFESTDAAGGWDGNYKNTIVPQGLYVYILEFRKDLPQFKEYKILQGTVLLME